ncbi:MAG: hypothetical protein BWK80_24165 [Desulfobacteraceae bacterium IS3]|nr:MAG: hypothetical protein BWK80_24165 [Desulfobacteraceae bacterium IS3]
MKFRISLAVLGLFCIMFIASSCNPRKQENQGDGKIISLSGDVFVDGQKAEQNSSVKPGARIKTGSNSSCEIVFSDKSIIKFYENSEAAVDLSSPSKSLNLFSGAVASVVKHLGKIAADREYNYTVTTPTSVAGIRGTSFLVKAEDENKTDICVCNGVVDLKDSEGKNRNIVEAAHHKGLRFARDEKGIHFSEIHLSESEEPDHDEEMERIAKKVNVRIDWTKADKESE